MNEWQRYSMDEVRIFRSTAGSSMVARSAGIAQSNRVRRYRALRGVARAYLRSALFAGRFSLATTRGAHGTT